MSNPLASVCIPVYNRPKDVQGLLPQLQEQSYTNFEVILVDDGSTPPLSDNITPEMYAYPITLVRLEKQGGVARARNQLINHAHGEIILFLDSDCVLCDPQWIEKHVRFHQNPRHFSKISTEDCFVLHSRVIGLHTTYAGHSDGYSNWFVSCGKRPYEARNHHVPTNNTSVRKALFEKTGGFDESLVVAEDADWAFRCLQQGVRLFYVPDMPVQHRDRNSFRAVWEHYHTIGKYALAVREKNHQSPYKILYPYNRLTSWLYLLSLPTLMTVYITLKWLLHDPRVLWYIPGLHFANIAYYFGLLEAMREKNPAKPSEKA